MKFTTLIDASEKFTEFEVFLETHKDGMTTDTWAYTDLVPSNSRVFGQCADSPGGNSLYTRQVILENGDIYVFIFTLSMTHRYNDRRTNIQYFGKKSHMFSG